MAEYDLFIIGAGAGGVAAARRAAEHGAKVAIGEIEHVGGTCVFKGCIPKKFMFHAAEFHYQIKIARNFGWNIGDVNFSWNNYLERQKQELHKIKSYYTQVLEKLDVSFYKGKISLTAANKVEVNYTEYQAKNILIATGSTPNLPEIPGIEHVITSDQIFTIEKLPAKIVIIGAGYIALEFASIFNSLGVETHVVHRHQDALMSFDVDLRTFVTKEMQKKGIKFYPGQEVSSIEKYNTSLSVKLRNGTSIMAEQVMYAIGRKPMTAGLNLEAMGVKIDESKANVITNENYQTNIPGIFAIGDVTNNANLTSVAIKEGRAFADNHFNGQQCKLNYNNIPSAVFCSPAVASVGLTEEAARKTYANVEVYSSEFSPMKPLFGQQSDRAYFKIVVDSQTDKILGIHLVSDDAAEMIQGFAVALNCNVTMQQLDQTIAVHPTTVEALVLMKEKKR